MNKNFWYALIFFLFLILVVAWKWWVWIIWKVLRLRKKEQVFNLLAKYRYIEITGASGKGKSWLLSHLFKHLQAVKFTNFPTPQSTYTLSKETLEVHISGKWGAPNKFYYLLDDIDTFQKWSKQEFGESGYSALQDYISHIGKLGGTFIWTSNGTEIDPVFQANKNKTWKVLTYITFLDKSLLFLQANDKWYSLLPTIIPIDNKEIQSFYDPHWNIPKDYQKNWLNYIADQLKAEELKEILKVIEEGGNDEEWIKDKKFNRNLLLQYLAARKKEEKIVRQKSTRIKEIKTNLKKYGINDKKLTPTDIEKWDKEAKLKKQKLTKSKAEVVELDLDQENQEPAGELTENEVITTQKKTSRKSKKR